MVELLAPVGKMETAIAAIENGADALFIGGKHFSARQAADNFTNEELEEIVRYARLRGVKVYVTVNILIKESEMAFLLDYLYHLEAIGVDAIIIQDLGIARLVKRYGLKLRLHASTQLSAHSIKDVQFLQSLGFKRIVLAREMKLNEIKEIIKTCTIEIETFIHGALCYSYSGQCLMSSLIGGRSGNRGYCAQTCRMRYTLRENGKTLSKSSYLLSLKDICSLEFLPELIETGIHSFKIEGRMKSSEYVASVVGMYRKYINLAQSQEPYHVLEEDLQTLKSIFNRGGFSKGYYFNNKKLQTPVSPKHIGIQVGQVINFSYKTGTATIRLTGNLNKGDGIEIIREGKESVGTGISKECTAGSTIRCQFDKNVEVGSPVYLTKNHLLLKQMRQTYIKPQRKLPITMMIQGKINQPITIQLSTQGKTIHYQGDSLIQASTNAVTKEKALQQLTKLGNTSFKVESVEIEWDDNVYINISALNQIRREAVTKLEEALLQNEKRSKFMQYEPEAQDSMLESTYAVYVTSLEQLKVVLNYPEVQIIYWEWTYDDENARKALEICRDKKFYLALPSITKEVIYKKYQETWFQWDKIDGFLVRNAGQFYILNQYKDCIIDFNMNVTNNETLYLWQQLGAKRITLSVELAETEVEALQGNIEQIVYGHIPVMTSAQCVLKSTPSCQKEGKVELEDRKQVIWNIKTDCTSCIMQIMSHKPLVLNQKLKKGVQRIQLTKETDQETKVILESYLSHKQTLKGVTFPRGL